MALHLLHGVRWSIVGPPPGALRNLQKGCITGSVRIILLALTNTQGSSDYTLVCLVTQGPSGLPAV